MASVSKEFELASRVVALCKEAAKNCPDARLPFASIWDDVKEAPLSVVFSQAKAIVDTDEMMADDLKLMTYYVLGRFFGGLLRYGKDEKGVMLKIRNDTGDTG